jgi:hypothetical protein
MSVEAEAKQKWRSKWKVNAKETENGDGAGNLNRLKRNMK